MKKTILEEKHFWVIPVKNKGRGVPIQVCVSNERNFLKLDFDLGSENDCDYLAYYPIPFHGEEVEIEAPEEFFDTLTRADDNRASLPSSNLLCQKFHYQAPTGWLNDPNGMYHYHGEWHMFHQYNPIHVHWGNMHWYHASSKDFVNWTHHGIFLYPDAMGMMYSGGAVIDFNNVSQLGVSAEHPPILLYYTASPRVYTHTNEWTQCIAYSVDGGQTFKKYENNPIIHALSGGGERDPVVRFHEKSNEWVMLLYLGDKENGGKPFNQFAVLTSTNLLDWTERSRFTIEGERECPGFFFAKTGRTQDERIVVFGANGIYQSGVYANGCITFTEKPNRFLLPFTNRCEAYAGQYFCNAPDDKIVLMAWQRMPPVAPNAIKSQAMTLPLELKFQSGKINVSPYQTPSRLFTRDLEDDLVCSLGCEIEFAVTNPVKEAVLELNNLCVRIRLKDETLVVNGLVYPRLKSQKEFHGRIFIDASSIELFDLTNGDYYSSGLDAQSRVEIHCRNLNGHIYNLQDFNSKN